jgi:hypothetical protein
MLTNPAASSSRRAIAITSGEGTASITDPAPK